MARNRQPDPTQDDLAALGLFKRKTGLPKGTTDVVMDRLFPSRKSKVDVSEERRTMVFEILVSVGVIIPKEEPHA